MAARADLPGGEASHAVLVSVGLTRGVCAADLFLTRRDIDDESLFPGRHPRPAHRGGGGGRRAGKRLPASLLPAVLLVRGPGPARADSGTGPGSPERAGCPSAQSAEHAAGAAYRPARAPRAAPRVTSRRRRKR